jgi:hypothetical protein
LGLRAHRWDALCTCNSSLAQLNNYQA